VEGLIGDGEPVRYFRFPGLAAIGLVHLTTTRHCPGVTPSSQPTGPFTGEAATVLASAGIEGGVAYARQVHGADVVAPERSGYAGVADVLVTTERRRPLAVFTADCLAITLCDPEAPALGVAHAGWRGTVRGAAQAAVEALVRRGARAERLRAAIAPSIGPCCYEVDAPVIEAFEAAYPGRAAGWFSPARSGHAMLDLWTANEALLAEAGVDRRRIENPRLCTACHPDLLFSYRKGNHGRLVTVAALP
jgi:YfiH family protein